MLHQIVYVVIDSIRRVIIAVCNTEDDAKKVALNADQPDYLGNEISITPVLVDGMYEEGEEGYRPLCWNEGQLQDALKNEFALAAILDQQEAEAEAEEEEAEDEDEDEDEDLDDEDEDEDLEDEDEDEDEDDDEEDDEEEEDSTIEVITEAADTIATAVADVLRAVWDKIKG